MCVLKDPLSKCECLTFCRQEKTHSAKIASRPGGDLDRPTIVQPTSDYEAQLARLIARYNNLDPRGRATLLRMAECMPTGQVGV